MTVTIVRRLIERVVLSAPNIRVRSIHQCSRDHIIQERVPTDRQVPVFTPMRLVGWEHRDPAKYDG